MTLEKTAFPFEFKLAGAQTGEIEGYGSVFNHRDGHGDVIKPGAFAESLAKSISERRSPQMYMQHGAVFGGDPRPVGVWNSVQEDGRGLKVAGRLVGLDTETGRYNHALVRDGAMRGLSIGFRVAPGGAVFGKEPHEPRRTLTKVNLHEISIVDDPSNSAAQITSFKMSSQRDLERLLRDGGVPKAAAIKVASAGWPALADDEPQSPEIERFMAKILAATRELTKG